MKTTKDIYTCDICKKEHDTEEAMDKCVLSHDIVYVGLGRQEWKSLLLSIMYAHRNGAQFDEKVLAKLLKYKFGVKS